MARYICPICGNNHSCKPGKDKLGRDIFVLCFRGADDGFAPKDTSYKFVKKLNLEMGGLWVQPSDAKDYDYNPFKKLPDQNQVEDSEWETLDDITVDSTYRKLLSYLDLESYDINVLKKRGIHNPTFAKLQGFRTYVTRKPVDINVKIPGVRNGMIVGWNGLFIPTVTPWGKLVGGQIAPRRKDLPKYLFIDGATKFRVNKGFPIATGHSYPDFATERNISVAKLIVNTYSTNLETTVVTSIIDNLGVSLASAAKSFKPFQNKLLAELNALLLGLQLALTTGIEKLEIVGVNPQTRNVIKTESDDLRIETLARFVRELLDFQFNYSFTHEGLFNIHKPTEQDFIEGEKYLDTKEVWFVDGTGKAWYAAQKHKKIFLGCPAGNHPSNMGDLKAYLEALQPERCVHAPDSGDVINTSTIPLISYKLHNTLTGLKYETVVAWWGQVTKKEKDIDEIDTIENVAYISTEDFIDLHPPEMQLKMVKTRFYRAGIHPISDPIYYPREIEYKTPSYFTEGFRSEIVNALIQSGVKFIHDSSFAGSGKSRDFSTWQPDQFDASKLWWVVNDPVSVEYPDWAQYRGRDFGRTLREDGRVVKATADTPIEDKILQANCLNAPFADFLASNNVPSDGEKICTGCPWINECKSNPSWYLKARKIALNAPRLRMHPSTLDEALFKTPSGDKWTEDTDLAPEILLILDDIDAWIKSITLNVKDINNLIDNQEENLKYIPTLRNLLVSVRFLMCQPSKEGFKDLQHNDLISKLPKLGELNETYVERLIEAENERIAEAFDSTEPIETPKAWIADFIKAFQGNGHINTYQGNFSIHTRNERLIKALKHPAIKGVVFADATAKTEHLEKWVNSSIESIAQELPTETAKLQITQVVGMGDVGYRRSEVQLEKLTKLKDFFRTNHPDYKAIDIKAFQDHDSLTWLSTSRGSNVAKNANGLVCYGTPRANLAALYAKYALLTGIHPDETTQLTPYPVNYSNRSGLWARVIKESVDQGFAEFCHQSIKAEIVQAFNRLRHARRVGEVLDIIFVSEYPLDEAVSALTMDELIGGYKAPSLKLRSKQVNVSGYQIVEAAKILQKLKFRATRRAIALIAEVSECSVRSFFDKPGRDWKEFKTRCETGETLDAIELWGFDGYDIPKDPESLTLNNSNTDSQNPKTLEPQGIQPLKPPLTVNQPTFGNYTQPSETVGNPKTVFKFSINP
jgi:hypothetical protein